MTRTSRSNARENPKRAATTRSPPRARLSHDGKRWSVRFLQEPVDQTVGTAAVGEDEMAREVARRGCEVEALVLFVAAGERTAREIPGQAEDADALVGRHALGAGQVLVDQRPQ